jgi:hypothetical protein
MVAKAYHEGFWSAAPLRQEACREYLTAREHAKSYSTPRGARRRRRMLRKPMLEGPAQSQVHPCPVYMPLPTRPVLRALHLGLRDRGFAKKSWRRDTSDCYDNNQKRLISAAEPDLMANDPTRVLMRQLLGAVAQYDKSQLVRSSEARGYGSARVRAAAKGENHSATTRMRRKRWTT